MVDQHSALRVKLSDIVEGSDFQSDERSSFLNLTTGDVVAITDEEIRAAENDAIIPAQPPSLVITGSAALAFRKHRCENTP